MSKLKKALVIEDTSFMQNTFKFYFYELGWDSPTIVETGEDALHVLQDSADTFDVIILDQKLPGMSGVATLAAARMTIENMPPVVMITGDEKANVALAEQGLSVEAFMFKSKLNVKTLKALLAQVLERA